MQFDADVPGILRSMLWFFGLTWKLWVPILAAFVLVAVLRGRRR